MRAVFLCFHGKKFNFSFLHISIHTKKLLKYFFKSWEVFFSGLKTVLNLLFSQVNEVVDVMRDNVSKMMEREEKLSDIGQDRLPFLFNEILKI